MIKRNIWKIVLSLAILAWALITLLPLKSRDFVEYAKSAATAKEKEFAALVDEARTRGAQAHPVQTPFVALKQIAKERKLDLAQLYFPKVNLGDVRNIERRNTLLLDELLKRSKAKLQLGLDLAGGVAFTLEVDDKALADVRPDERQEKLSKAVDILHQRIDGLGVAEPIIRPVGDNRIEVQLPGVSTKDNPEVVDSVKKPARLEFRIVHPTAIPGPGVETPLGYEVLTLSNETKNGDINSYDVFVKRIPEMTGESMANAYTVMDEYGRFKIILRFTQEGRGRFAAVTRTIAENNQRTGRTGQLAIVLDGKLQSAPTVREEINNDSAEISGSFTQRDAEDLANVLNNPLDLPLQIKEQLEVGPSLAEDAVSSGIRASIIGAAAVAAFMITFYATGGLVAVFSLAVNVVIILGIMASFGATMTLPGLAGIVLTIGMAVDANILIFERMREEIAVGKSLVTANHAGFIKALTTIMDAHLVQLIICGIMIWLGTGPIKGFGVTLAIGVVSTLFSVLITGHLVMEMLTESGFLKKMTMRRMLKDIRVDWVKYGKPAFIGSWVIVILGVAVVAYKGNRIYGIDFAGGDLVTLQFNQKPDIAKVREAARSVGVTDINVTTISSIGEQSSGKETLKLETPEGKSGIVVEAVQKAFPSAGIQKIGESHIGASIGKEIQWTALLAVGVSMMTILVYIAFRFEFGFGIGAMFSSLHDILMTIGIFVLFGHQFSAPMVAAILCIAGYSINETVVVFDRIREELRDNPTGSLRTVVNSAINKVFARTIMTSTTTFLAALSLFLFGGGVLRDISFTFLVGIVTATFSAVFIAAQVFYWWHKGDRKQVEKHQDVKPTYEWTGASKASQ